jgi:hypothetical protein
LKTLYISIFLLTMAPVGADDCTVDAAIQRLHGATIDRVKELGARMGPVLSQLEAINSRAKDPKRPLIEQLSQSDIDDFNQANAQFKYLAGLTVLERTRQQQLELILGLLKASEVMQKARAQYMSAHGSLDGFDLETVATTDHEKLLLKALLSLEPFYAVGPE